MKFRKTTKALAALNCRSLIVLTATLALAGCGNKSSVCSTDEVVENLSDLSKSNMLMFDQIRADTEEPPYLSDKAWIELSKSLASLKTKLETNETKLSSEQAICSALPTEQFNLEAANKFETEAGIRAERMEMTAGMFYMANVRGGQLFEATADVKPKYKRLCAGDFSDLDTKYFNAIMPNRYRAWYEKVRPLAIEVETLAKLISDKEIALSEYENRYYENSFKSVKYNFSESSLDSQNDSETNYTCSSKISSDLKGWKIIDGTINYVVKITDSGKSKIEIIQDASFEKLAPFMSSNGNGLDAMIEEREAAAAEGY
nr:hypothetical protein [uncultured Sphingorhabdus sp.]